MTRARLAVLSSVAALLVPVVALAQGEHSAPMRPGTFRFGLGADWGHWDDRFSTATPLRPTLPDGTLEPLGSYFSSDSLGTTLLPSLAPAETHVQNITGLTSFRFNLGRARLTMDASVRTHPLRLAYAPSSRLAFQVTVPIVRARVSAFVLGSDSTAATQGNVGTVAAGVHDTFRDQADSVLVNLQRQIANGPASLAAQAQSQLNALTPLLCALNSIGTATADPTCSGFAPAANILPLSGSAAGDSIGTILSRAQAGYTSLRNQYAAQGITLPPLNTAFSLPTTPLDSAGLRTLLTDPNGPLGGDSLSSVVRTGIGDIEVGGWFQLANGNSWRSQVGVLVRLPTGKMDDPDNFLDIGTGDHQTDVEVSFRNDIVVNRNLWLHAGGRYGLQMADELVRRVTPWYLPLAPASSAARVRRDLGDYIALDVVPNWQFDEAFGFGLGWHWFHQGATTFTLADPTITPPYAASVLGEATSVSRMRVGAGLTFSTLERYRAGRAKLPYRVSWSYQATLYGRGGQVPHAGVMMLEIQAFFGNLR